MKYTIISLNLNNCQGLKKTIDSVLSQSCKDYEYIVIDGGSTDGSKTLIQNTPGIDHWVSEPDKGIYNAMNKGINIATGEYCIFMNSGDSFYDNTVLEKVYPHLNGGDFYVGNTIEILDGQERTVYSPLKMTLDAILTGFINHQSTFTKTSLLKERPYNEKYKIVSDWEKLLKEWFLHNKSYTHMDIIISRFPLDGISYTNQDLSWKERNEVLEETIPAEILKMYLPKQETPISPFKRKIEIAFTKPPVSRDWKIFRNAFKFLMKDIACFLFNHKQYKKEK